MMITFVGGGSLGPVTPLLAVAEALRRLDRSAQVTWIGTPDGPERLVVEAAGIPFHFLPVVKWPRYPSWRWLTFPFDWIRVRHLASELLTRLKSEVVVSAGGFTAAPVFIEAAKQGVPCVAHQLDLKPALTNRRIARLCDSVTTSFEYERPPFGEWVSDERIPTPVRFHVSDLPTRAAAAKHFGLDPKQPIILIFGGGTGSQPLNQHVQRTKKRWLAFTQVLHLTGKGKDKGFAPEKGYIVRDLLVDEMVQAYAAADLVISRAGFATLSEMTAGLSIPNIVVPLPGTEQEANAKAFEEQGGLVVVEQSHPRFDEELLATAELFLHDEEGRRKMGSKAHAFLPTDDGTTLAKRILKIVKARAKNSA